MKICQCEQKLPLDGVYGNVKTKNPKKKKIEKICQNEMDYILM